MRSILRSGGDGDSVDKEKVRIMSRAKECATESGGRHGALARTTKEIERSISRAMTSAHQPREECGCSSKPTFERSVTTQKMVQQAVGEALRHFQNYDVPDALSEPHHGSICSRRPCPSHQQKSQGPEKPQMGLLFVTHEPDSPSG